MTTMTRAHYKLIAESLALSFKGLEMVESQPLTESQRSLIVSTVAAALSKTNPRFSYSRFYEATMALEEKK